MVHHWWYHGILKTIVSNGGIMVNQGSHLLQSSSTCCAPVSSYYSGLMKTMVSNGGIMVVSRVPACCKARPHAVIIGIMVVSRCTTGGIMVF